MLQLDERAFLQYAGSQESCAREEAVELNEWVTALSPRLSFLEPIRGSVQRPQSPELPQFF